MIKIIDTLQKDFGDKLVITDQDRNGKQYENTRWIYPKDKERRGNVLIEIGYKPTLDRIDFIIKRELLTPSEDKESESDGNPYRRVLDRYNMTEKQLKDYVVGKLNKYYENLT